MRVNWSRALPTLTLLATLGLVGCGSTAAAAGRPAAAALEAANTKALSGSFEVAFSAQLHVDLSQVAGLTGVTPGELSQAQSEINAARLTGTAEVQSQQQMEMTFSLTPVMAQPWHLILVDGSEYISEGGSTWYKLSGGRSGLAAGVGGTAGAELRHLKQELKSWGQELKSSARVTDLGRTEIGGRQVKHLETTLSGPSMNHFLSQILAQVATELGSSDPSLAGALPALEQMLDFTQVRGESYVLTSTGQLARASVEVSLTLDLGGLSSLAPGATGLPSGSASLGFAATGNFSNYGQSFNIQAPSHVTAGPLPTPSGLSGALS